MEKGCFEDYRVGEVFVSPARTLTETDIVNFAGLTGDWHPVHTDAEYAATTVFGERIAHGLLTLCIGSALVYRLGPYVTLPRSFIAFYGIDTLRFVAPCRIGDTIRCRVEIRALEEKDPGRGIIVADNTIYNQRQEACVVYTTRALVGRKGAA